ncbi:MAG TPA: hypothetical protein VK816_09515 [Jatrophihabitantaceae bacterium]|jgi:predicted lipoprotein with Yx(FWY)xxD motif|nr:hypothetical protein [Jatrophihabitantaceae bacterium]
MGVLRFRRPGGVTLVVAVFGALCLAGCGRAVDSVRDPLLEILVPAQVTVQAQDVAGLGSVLSDGQEMTLYMFPPDAGRRVSCTGPCAGTWPPLVVGAGGKVIAGTGVDAADLGTLADPNTGERIVTYAGFPLYRYAGDLRAGTANGQGLFLNGGPWYVLSADGQPITVTPAPAARVGS